MSENHEDTLIVVDRAVGELRHEVDAREVCAGVRVQLLVGSESGHVWVEARADDCAETDCSVRFKDRAKALDAFEHPGCYLPGFGALIDPSLREMAAA